MLKCMAIHIKCTMYVDSYRGYDVWRLIWRVQCVDTHIEGTMYGYSYRRYKVWRLI